MASRFYAERVPGFPDMRIVRKSRGGRHLPVVSITGNGPEDMTAYVHATHIATCLSKRRRLGREWFIRFNGRQMGELCKVREGATLDHHKYDLIGYIRNTSTIDLFASLDVAVVDPTHFDQ